MTEIKWNFIQTVSANGIYYDEYESEDGKLCKQIWSDGYEEIFEIA